MKKLICVFLCFFIPVPAFAQIVISEVAWMGTPVEGVEAKQWWRYEWIELYNTSSSSVSLDGWKVELSRPSSEEASAGKDKLDWIVSLDGIIAGQDYFLVAASDKISNVDVNYANLGGKFTNSGQKIVLRDTRGNIEEEVDAHEGWFSGENSEKHTMERWKLLKDGNTVDNWGTSELAGGTPRKENSIAQLATLEVEEPVFAFGRENREEKKDLFWSSVFLGAVHPALFFALLTALGSVLGLLALKKYLGRPPGPERF